MSLRPATLLLALLAACATTPPPEPAPAPVPTSIQTAAPPPRPPAETVDDELRRKPPEIGAPGPVTIPTLHEEQAAGGIRLVVAERATIPLLTLQLVFRWGEGAAPLLRSEWLLQFLEDPTPAAPEGARAALQPLTTQVNFAEHPGASVISLNLEPDALPRVLAILTSALERTTWKAGRQPRTPQGSGFLLRDMQLVAYTRNERLPPGHPRRGASGEAPSKSKVKASDLEHFQATQVAPSMLTVVVSGAVTAAAARQAIDGSLGRWTTKARVKSPPPLPAVKPLWIMDPGKSPGTTLVFSIPPPARPELPPVAGELLFADFLEHIRTRLRETVAENVNVNAALASPDSLDFVVHVTSGMAAATIVQVRAELEAEAARNRKASLGPQARRLQDERWGILLQQLESTHGLANLTTGVVLGDRPLDELARTARLLQPDPTSPGVVVEGSLLASQLRVTIVGSLAAERKMLTYHKLGTPESHRPPPK